jgi:hypothetical protein
VTFHLQVQLTESMRLHSAENHQAAAGCPRLKNLDIKEFAHV